MRQSKSKSPSKKNDSTRNSGTVRIIGGQMRGRKLAFSVVEGLRPTLDRIRETLFNWLSRDINDSQCLDLFAGSGALGFEAASRGAKNVVMVERNKQVATDLQNNCQLIQANNIKVVNLEAIAFLQLCEQKFDLVFVDPPFGKGMLNEVLEYLPKVLNQDALVYIEQENADSASAPNEQWQQIKFKKTSSITYALYQYI